MHKHFHVCMCVCSSYPGCIGRRDKEAIPQAQQGVPSRQGGWGPGYVHEDSQGLRGVSLMQSVTQVRDGSYIHNNIKLIFVTVLSVSMVGLFSITKFWLCRSWITKSSRMLAVTTSITILVVSQVHIMYRCVTHNCSPCGCSPRGWIHIHLYGSCSMEVGTWVLPRSCASCIHVCIAL